MIAGEEDPSTWSDVEICRGRVGRAAAQIERWPTLGGETDWCGCGECGSFDGCGDGGDDIVTASRERREEEQRARSEPTGATHRYTCMNGQTRGMSGIGRRPRASTTSWRAEPRARRTGVDRVGKVVRLMYPIWGSFGSGQHFFALFNIKTPKRSRTRGFSVTTGRCP